MKYRYLGKSGLAVATVCLGTATFGQSGWGCDEEAAHGILDAYTEAGGNFIDTADKYGDEPGTAERIIGKWLAGRNRDELVIASKCFFETSSDINARGLSRKHIIQSCEASLKRLGTDYLDLYQMHRPDPQTPLEETLDALDTLVQQGKVRYIGCGDYPAWKLTKACSIAERTNRTRFISSQYLYNLLKRDIEAEVLPACADSGIGVLCWSPLSGGMLTGKYTDAQMPPENTRMSERTDVTTNRYKQWHEKSQRIVQMLEKIAERFQAKPAVVALAWLLHDERISAVIVGAKRPAQIHDNCIAGAWALPDEEYSLLDELSQIKHPYPHDIYSGVANDWFATIR